MTTSCCRAAKKTDWEVELGIVMGKHAAYVTKEEALEYVAGYCICNDVSERAFQIEGTGQWTKGKSCDTFGPTGPWMVTKDEIVDVHNLSMWLTVNGETMQDGSTKTMIFDVPTLVSYCSEHMSLQPGDVISTGTPPGVGMGMSPQRFLKDGDVVSLGIEGLGQQTQHVITIRAEHFSRVVERVGRGPFSVLRSTSVRLRPTPCQAPARCLVVRSATRC